MFHQKTVFILGAGASHEVGLPLGDGLRQEIASKIKYTTNDVGRSINSDRVFDKAFAAISPNYSNEGRSNAATQLSEALSSDSSIDRALEKRKDIPLASSCGKLAIARIILEAERNSTLYFKENYGKKFPTNLKLTETLQAVRQPIDINNQKEPWLVNFLQILSERFPTPEKIFNNVTFVSFNYDRCVSHFLYNALQRLYSKTPDETAAIMKGCKILYPYGSLGKLRWQTSFSEHIPFGLASDHRSGDTEDDLVQPLIKASQNLKTFSENIDFASDKIQEIRNAVQEATTIVFLGFAFHKQNIELLKPDGRCQAEYIYATATGISADDCVPIRRDLEAMLQQGQSPTANIAIRNDLKCAELLNNYSRCFR